MIAALPWRLLGGLVVALAVFFWGYQLGGKHEQTACVAGQVRAQQAAVDAAATESGRREAVGAARETSREQIRVVYRTLRAQAAEGVAVGVAGGGCGLDVDGLRVWNAANLGVAAPLPSQPDGSLPNPATRALGEFEGLAGQSHRGDGAGSTVSGSVEQISGVQSQHVTVKRPIAGATASHLLPQSADYVSNVSEVQSQHVTVKRPIAGATASHLLPQSADYVSNVSEVRP